MTATTALAKSSAGTRTGSFPLARGLANYAVLKDRVGEVLIRGRRKIEREFVRMRFHTGLLINEHVRLNNGRAGYGEKALLNLGKDFDLDQTELARYSQFARSYPILGGRRELKFNLPWHHYRKLMIIGDDRMRFQLTAEAEQKEWTYEKVEARVRYLTSKEKEDGPPRLPFVCLGSFLTYKIIRTEDPGAPANGLRLDLGFSCTKELAAITPRKFQPGDIVSCDSSSQILLRTPNAVLRTQDSLLYTYQAFVQHVVDGDTLKIDLRLGFGDHKGETLRLNHIDCPELDTPEGKRAKQFVESELAGCGLLTVKSVQTRKEKWGRYLADVFYQRKGKGALIYLNQLLLDKGHAVLYRRT